MTLCVIHKHTACHTLCVIKEQLGVRHLAQIDPYRSIVDIGKRTQNLSA